MTFNEIGVSETIVDALSKQNITVPTKIQESTYKNIVDGKDVIGNSETGSGKTLAYLLPLYSMINSDDRTVQALIIVPTQELAIQIQRQIEFLSNNSGISISSITAIGDGNINRQIEMLKKNKPQIVIGTTGRILQLNKMKKLHVHTVKTLVIDEADKMLDKTNYESLVEIRKTLMKITQVVMFSASIDAKAIKVAEKLTVDPIIIKESFNLQIPTTIKHIFVLTDRRERIETMRKIAKSLNPDKAIVFINTKYDLEESLQKLQFHHYNVQALYSSATNKFDRKNAINGFKEGKIQYLIATDIGARGLQVDGITTVINVNLPEDPKDYLHRAGRCGRNGQEGICISIITENELPKIKEYQKQFKISVIQKKLYQGKLVAK